MGHACTHLSSVGQLQQTGKFWSQFQIPQKTWDWGCLILSWRCSVTTGTESHLIWRQWVWVVEGKMCWQELDVACSISSCEEQEKGQGSQPSFRLGRAAVLNPAGCGRHKKCCVLHWCCTKFRRLFAQESLPKGKLLKLLCDKGSLYIPWVLLSHIRSSCWTASCKSQNSPLQPSSVWLKLPPRKAPYLKPKGWKPKGIYIFHGNWL